MEEKTLLPLPSNPPLASSKAHRLKVALNTRTPSSFLKVVLVLLALPVLLLQTFRLSRVSPYGHNLGILRSPNATIRWHACPDAPGIFCSSLKVPLNWLDPVPGEDADIFLKMYPAAEDKRQGSMLVNPGGPGGSGSIFVERAGASLSQITNGVFDIVGFDPRGVNLTAPFMQAFDDTWAAQLFTLENAVSFSYDPSKQTNLTEPLVFKEQLRLLRHHDAIYGAMNDGVRQHTTETERKSVSTAFVVRDMVALVDALGDGDELIYWGFSYGTILGATFAAMMPNRVGRMILDGVSHAGDYTSSLEDWGWSSMTDSNAVVREFYRLCAEAGPTRCALASRDVDQEDLDAAATIEKDVNGLIERLWEEPLFVRTSKFGPGLLQASQVHLLIFQALYAPAKWADTASAVAAAVQGNGTLARNLLGGPTDLHGRDPRRTSLEKNVYNRKVGGGAGFPSTAILCSDEEPETDSLEEILVRAGELRRRSYTAPEWTSFMLPCRTWKDRPFERYTGPWTVEDGLRKTKNKVLWVGNTHDPVTPLASAKRMADGFGRDSGSLLIQDGNGHCTTADPSLCTVRHLRAYLVNGTVPEWGTTCVSEPGTAFPPLDGAQTFAGVDEEEAKLLRAMRELHEVSQHGGLGLGF